MPGTAVTPSGLRWLFLGQTAIVSALTCDYLSGRRTSPVFDRPIDRMLADLRGPQIPDSEYALRVVCNLLIAIQVEQLAEALAGGMIFVAVESEMAERLVPR